MKLYIEKPAIHEIEGIGIIYLCSFQLKLKDMTFFLNLVSL